MQQAMNEDIREVPDEPSARRLAEWALSLKLSDVEPAVLEKVKLHILDQIGVQVSCRNLPTCAITREYVTKYGLAGPSAILGTNLRVDPEYAGLTVTLTSMMRLNASTGISPKVCPAALQWV